MLTMNSKRRDSTASQRILVLAFLTLFGYLSANSAPDPFAAALDAYKAARFSEACSIFDELIKKYPESPELLYNAGNCYFKLGRYGEAMLYWAKANKLAPQDRDVEENIKYAAQLLNDPDWTGNFVDKINMPVLKIIASSMVLYLSIVMSLKLYDRKRNLFWHSLISTILSVTLLIFLLIRTISASGRYGVCLSKNAGMRSGPSEEFSVSFMIPEGKKVKVISESGEWYEIAVKSKAVTGWIEKKHISEI